MFLAVWMLYAADRLLDAKPLFTAPSSLELEERHRFHHRHRKAFQAAICGAALPLVALLHHTAEAVLHLYVLLASLLGVWLLIVHARPAPSTAAHRLPKELAVGVFFPAAVFIPTVARAPSLRPTLALCAFSFAALCTLNCLFLYAWEHPGETHHAHATTRWAVRHLPAITVLCALCGNGVFLLAQALGPFGSSLLPDSLAHPAAPLLASGMSGLFLLMLHTARHRVSGLRLRVLADLVLLTPIPLYAATVVSQHHP